MNKKKIFSIALVCVMALAALAGTGDWQEGKRFSSNASEEEIQDWVKSLNLN